MIRDVLRVILKSNNMKRGTGESENRRYKESSPHPRISASSCLRVSLSFLTILLLTICLFSPAFAKGGDIVSPFPASDAQTGKQAAVASAVDSLGNVIVTGYHTIGGSNNEFYTVKFAFNGAVAWRAAYNKDIGDDSAVAVVIDSSNNIIVTGTVWNGQNYDIHTIKYDPDGNVLGQHTFNASANNRDTATAVALDSSGNIYVGGYSRSSTGDDYVLLKYLRDPSAGQQLVLDASFDSDGVVTYNNGTTANNDDAKNGNDQITSIAVGANGVVVTGGSESNNGFDYVTIKYGFNGAELWRKRYSSAGVNDDSGLFVKIDSAGDVIVTGYTTSAGNRDIYTVKYNGATGSQIWERPYSNTPDDEPKGLWIDSSNDVYITGHIWTLTGKYEFYTARYNGGTGALIWEKTFGTGGDNDDVAIPTGIVVSDDVFVTGYTYKVAETNYDFQTIKYKKDNGNQLWQASYDGAAHKDDEPVGIGLSPSGEIYIAGWSDKWTGGSSDYDYLVIKYDQGLLNAPTNLTAEAISSTEVALTWSDNSSNEDGFRIERKLCSSGTYSVVKTILSNSTSTAATNDPGLAPDTKYCYQVKAYNAANGETYPSNEDYAITTIINYAPPSWSRTFDGTDHGNDIANSIAVGPDNNPVVTGQSWSTVEGTQSVNYYTIKIDRQNGGIMWSALYDGGTASGVDIAEAITVDGGNGVIVSGYSTLFNPQGAAQDTNDIYTIKYASSCSPVGSCSPSELWADRYDGPNHNDDRSVAVAAAVDGLNNVAVVGYGKNGILPLVGNDDIYVLKYSSGGARAWAATPYDGGGNDYPTAVAFDYSGNVIVTGYTYTAASSTYDFFTRKYDADGNVVWTDVYPNPYGNDRAKAVAVDSSNNVYVTGYIVNSSGNEDFFTIKYNGATGARMWLGDGRSYDGPAHGNDEAVAIKVDPIDGYILVSGTSLTDTGDQNFHIIRYSPTIGGVDWEKTLQRPAYNDIAVGMAMDLSGNVCVAGNTSNGLSTDIMSIKYSYLGEIIGATIYNGPDGRDDYANAVTTNSLGEAFVAGYSMNASNNADYAVFKCAWDPLQVPTPFNPTPSYRSVTLNWTDNSTAEDGFRAEKKTGVCSDANTNPWTLVCDVSNTTTCTDAGLLDMGTEYCYRIKAYKNNGEASRWISKSVTTLTPAAPSNLKATALSTTEIKLSWTDNTNPETGFKIQRCTGVTCDFTSGVTEFTAASGSTTYADSSVCSGTAYRYRVSAYKTGEWESPYSSIATALTPTVGNVLPDPDFENTATNWINAVGTTSGTSFDTSVLYSGAKSLKLSASGVTLGRSQSVSVMPGGQYVLSGWLNTALTSGKAQCDVYGTGIDSPGIFSTGNSGGWVFLNEPVTIPSSTSSVYVRCFADGAPQGTANFDLIQLVAAPVISLTAVRYTEAQINLTWTDNNSDETGFKILRCSGSGCTPATTVNSPGANSTWYNDSGLDPNTLYRYILNTYKTAACGWSFDSIISEATTTVLPPSNIAPSIASASQVNVSWNDNTATETGFRIQRCEGPGCDFSVLTEFTTGPNSTSTMSYSDSSVCKGTTYRYRVRAEKSTAPSWVTDWNTSSDVTTPTPSAPTGLTASRISEVQIRLTWTDNTSGATEESGFKIERCDGAGCTEITTGGTAGTGSRTYQDTGLTPNTAYTYRVKAYKTANCNWETAYSLSSSATTTILPPGGLTANAVSTTQINLSWSDNTETETGFKIFRCTGACTPDTTLSPLSPDYIATAGAGANSYSDTGVCGGTTYDYLIKAVNEGLSNAGGGCWTTYVPLTITNFQSNFQTKVDVTYASGMQNDFDDIRFRDGYRELPSWIEKKTDGVSATFWVKTGANNNVTMYYGNPGATNASDGSMVFEFFDDFTGTEINRTKWTITDGTGFSVSGGALHGASTTGRLTSIPTFSSGIVLDIKASTTSIASNGQMIGGFYISSGDSIGWLNHPGNAYYRRDWWWYSFSSQTPTNNMLYTMQVKNSSTVNLQMYNLDTSAVFWNVGDVSNTVSGEPIVLGRRYDSDSYNGQAYATDWDWIRVRKYGATEPGVALGAAQTPGGCLNLSWASDPSSLPPATAGTPAPAAPTALTAGAVSESQIQVTWTDTTTGATQETGFKIERKAEACALSALSFIPIVPVNDAFDTSINSEIWGQLGRVYDSSGALVQEATVPPIDINDATNGVSKITALSGVVELKTTGAGGGTAGTYNNSRIYLKTPGVIQGDFDTQIDYSLPDGPIASGQYHVYSRLIVYFPNTTNGANYVYVERSVSSSGNAYSADIKVDGTSNAGSVTTADTVGKLRIARVGNKITVYVWTGGAWSPLKEVSSASTSAATYLAVIQYAQRNEGVSLRAYMDNFILNVSNADKNTLIDTNLSVGATYCYRVWAYKTASCPWEVPSGTAEATTLSPSAPSNLTTTVISATQVNLSWNDNTGTETGFRIQRCEGATCDFNSGVVEFTTGPNSTATMGYSDTSVCKGTTYRYRVRAEKNTSPAWTTDWNVFGPSDTASTPTPAAPTGLSATRVSESQIQLTWTDNTYGTTEEEGFKIERCAGACTELPISGATGTGARTYNDTNLNFDTTYTYRIKAHKTTGITCPWDTDYSSVTPASAATTVYPPSGLAAAVISATQINLSWNDNTATETGFRIQRCTGPGCDFSTGVTEFTTGANSTSTMSYSDTTVCNGTTYRYRVRAEKDAVWITAYTPSTPDVTTPTPAAPTGLSATRISETQIQVTWTDNTSGTTEETGFKIEKCAGACTDVTVPGTSGTGARTYNDSSLDPNTTYTYRIKAYKTATCAWDTDYNSSSPVSATTSVLPPSSLTADAIDTTQVRLTWTDNTVSETGFRIQRCEGAACNFSTGVTELTAGANSTSTMSFTDSTACKDTTYSYRVRAEKSSAPSWNSDWSTPDPASTPAPPAPENATAAATSHTQATITWKDNTTDESGFYVQRCLKDPDIDCTQDAHFTTQLTPVGPGAGQGTTITTTDSGLTPSKTYCYRAAAYKTSSCAWTTAYSAPACDVTFSATPSNLTASAISSMKIQLTWTDVAVDETGFEVEAQIWNGKWVSIATLGPNVTTYIDTMGIEPNKQYRYRVRALRGADISPYSNEAAATTPPYASGDNTCEYRIMISISGSGAVSASPSGVSCGASCYAYFTGASVTLTAKPGTGKSFVGWSDACTGNSTTCTITMDGDKHAVATFQ